MSARAWIDSKKPLLSSRSTPAPTLQQQQQQQQQQLRTGDRVQINSLHGIIRFIGTTKFKSGTWAGIELDCVGLGKNDGSVDGQRYFICPANTGLFILASKVLKQQHYTSLHNRPLTPHRSNSSKLSSPIRVLPPLPKKVILSEDNEILLLKKRIDALEAENKMLKQVNQCSNNRIQFLEQTVIEVKKAGMDSIEILESMVTSERSKVKELQLEQNDLRLAGLEAIESYESTLNQLQFDNQKLQQSHHQQIQLFLQDINVLENVLQNKMDKQVDLVQSLKRERQNNCKITSELKALKFQLKTSNDNTNNSSRWSFTRLDTPIEEEEEEEEEEEDQDLHCPLCDKQGHDVIHCSILSNQKHHLIS